MTHTLNHPPKHTWYSIWSRDDPYAQPPKTHLVPHVEHLCRDRPKIQPILLQPDIHDLAGGEQGGGAGGAWLNMTSPVWAYLAPDRDG